MSINDVESRIPSEAHDPVEAPYSIFDKPELILIGVLLGLGSIWSTLSSSIYFPAIPTISEDFHISPGTTNLSIVAYLVFQSFTPLLIAGLADTYGRRPFTLILLISYCGICVGISQVKRFWVMAVLRCVQAFSIASIISISIGTASDLVDRQYRGGFVGYVMGATLSAQAFGGLIGGGLVSRWDWQGLFIFCAIGSGAVFILDLFLLPESNRKIVGNSSVPPKHLVNKSPILMLPRIRRKLVNDTSTLIPQDSKLAFLILDTLKIFFSKLVFFTMLPGGFQFATWNMSMTALSTILRESYGYDDVDIGLAYLAPGIGGIVGSVAGGRLMNWNFRRHKAIYDEKYASVEDKPEFDVHAVRSQFCTQSTIVFCASILIFGWCIDKRVNVAPILIFSCICSAAITMFLSIIQTVLVDLYPSRSSASSSCFNLMRGLVAAAGVAAVQSIIDGVGAGWCFTIMVVLDIITFALFKLLLHTKP